MFYILSPLWFIRETKASLFWLYLWQLKEYHIGRFIDHFRTEKGKQLLFNKLLIFKIFLILIFLYGFSLFGFDFSKNTSSYFFELFVQTPFLVLILYILETARAVDNLFRKTLKKPVLTKKTTFLILAALVLEILFIIVISLYVKDEWGYVNFITATFYLLLFDILTPVIISSIVFLFQPVAVLARNRIIQKAKRKRAKFKNLLVIGITGSYGKTSTKEFLATILSEKYKVLKTKEHQNSEVGISQCILNDLEPDHEVFVVEMGAYNKGGIKLLCDIAKPKIGILTGINEQHMATFGSLENTIKTKYELIESLPVDGMAFFNAKNKFCVELYQKTKIKKFLYGKDVKTPGLENIEGAKMVAKELGMTSEEIERACQKIKNKFAGIQIKKGINGLDVIDATYSANPDSVIAHLEYLKHWHGKKIIITPCLIELGKSSKMVHQKIGKKIGEVCDLAIIITKECFDNIKKSAIKSGMEKKDILFSENSREIFEKIKVFSGPNNVILLESRVPKKIINFLTK